MIFPILHLSNNLKEKKRNINIDLTVLLSHDSQIKGTIKNIGKVGKELEMVERKVIRGKKNGNNYREKRNQERKFRS